MLSSHRQLRTCSSPVAGAERRGAPLQAHPQLSYWKCFLARCCERESKKKQIFKQDPCSKLPCLIQPPDSFTFSCFGDFFFLNIVSQHVPCYTEQGSGNISYLKLR